MLDNNQTSINSNNIFYLTEEGINSRILINIPSDKYDYGITAGDVIQWDTVRQSYVKASADSPENAEVFGIVEKKISGNLQVVINGSINLPNDKILNTLPNNELYNDVYFLSGTNPGYIDNIGPTFENFIIKPIYYKSPHKNFTGIVRNYLGYKNLFGIQVDPTPKNISLSDNLSYLLTYSDSAQQFYIYILSYGSEQFSKTLYAYFNKVDLESQAKKQILFNTDSILCDSKISIDGNHILLFSKEINKIYYIYLQTPTNPLLKYTIDVDLPGNPEDLIWAVDDELTSIAISTRALNRDFSEYESRETSTDICSKIQYYKRNLNSKIPYSWRKIHEQPAFGFCDVDDDSSYGSAIDSIKITPGVFRTSDLKCKEKNFSLGTNCLIQDQINYNSKKSGNTLRYSTILSQINGISHTSFYKINSINLSDVYISGVTLNNDNGANVVNATQFFCGFGLKNFNILNKNNNKYYENNSYRSASGIEYFAPTQMHGDSPTLAGAYLQKNNLVTNSVNVPARETQDVKVFSTLNHIFSCTLYRLVDSSYNTISKFLHIYSYPFKSYDNLTVFRYFEDSYLYTSSVPSGSNRGLIVNRDISLENINYFNFFASENRFFICSSEKVLVYEYPSLTNISISISNFDRSKFWYNNDGEFFLLNNKIYRYNTSTNQFDLKEI